MKCYISILLFLSCLSSYYLNAQTTWGLSKKILPDFYEDTTALGFGASVATNGRVLAVGAPGYNANKGAIFILSLEMPFDTIAVLETSQKQEYSCFGTRIYMSDSTLLAVSINATSDSSYSLGLAWVFTEPKDGWVSAVEDAYLWPDSISNNAGFAYGADVNDNVIVISAPYDYINGVGAGSVFVYQKPQGGWKNMSETTVLSSNRTPNSEYLGTSVSVSDSLICVGATLNNEMNAAGGAVYLFKKNGDNWSDPEQTAKLFPVEGYSNHIFGFSVENDDSTVFVGTRGYPGDYALYIFEKPISGWENATGPQSVIEGKDISDVEILYEIKYRAPFLFLKYENQENDKEYYYLLEKKHDANWDTLTIADSFFVNDTTTCIYNNSFAHTDSLVFFGVCNDSVAEGSGLIYLFEYNADCNNFSEIIAYTCDIYNSPAGNTYTVSGEYWEIIPNSQGCDSVIHIQLELPEDPEIEQNISLGMIRIQNEVYDTYQLINCDINDTSSAKSIDPEFYPGQSGSYAIQVQTDSCTLRSICLSIDLEPENIAKYTQSDINSLSIVPNPSSNQISILLHNTTDEIVNTNIYNISGKLINTFKGNDNYFDISLLDNGIYFVEVKTQFNTYRDIFIKE